MNKKIKTLIIYETGIHYIIIINEKHGSANIEKVKCDVFIIIQIRPWDRVEQVNEFFCHSLSLRRIETSG